MLSIKYDIFKACIAGDIEFVNNCLLNGASPGEIEEGGWTPLTLAIEHNQTEIVKLLLKYRAEVNFQINGGWTPLHHAIDVSIDGTIQTEGRLGNESIEMIKILLENGADMHLRTVSGESPLDFARSYQSSKIVEFLGQFELNNY